jgi:mono/diheme cytochrome c family protein
MKRLSIDAAISATGLVLVLLVLLAAPAIGAEGDAEGGKEAFLAAKCNTCHAVQAAGIEAKMQSEKMKGPDLDSSVAKIDKAELNKFLKKQGQLNGQDHMKEFKGTDEDLAKIIAWLSTQAPAE